MTRGLYANINARKKKGISRPKKKSTISPAAFANMKAGFPKKKKKKNAWKTKSIIKKMVLYLQVIHTRCLMVIYTLIKAILKLHKSCFILKI